MVTLCFMFDLTLVYPLRRIGYTGGLTIIEQTIGIKRSEDTTGITGFDAIRFWHKYEHDNTDTLELLLKYKQEDIVNLETISELTHTEFVKKTFSTAVNRSSDCQNLQ